MAQAVFSNQSLFPLTIPFSSHSKAATFRTRFYEFRRALRTAADLNNLKADHTSPSAMLLQGAETITSPRIDYSKPPVVIFQLQQHSEVYAEGLAFLSQALQAQEQLLPTTKAPRTPEPSSLEYYNFTTNRGRSYCIPSSHITDPSINTLHGLQARVQLVEARLEKSSSFLRRELSDYRTDTVTQAPEPTGYTDHDLQN